jgi:hypothetical protein
VPSESLSCTKTLLAESNGAIAWDTNERSISGRSPSTDSPFLFAHQIVGGMPNSCRAGLEPGEITPSRKNLWRWGHGPLLCNPQCNWTLLQHTRYSSQCQQSDSWPSSPKRRRRPYRTSIRVGGNRVGHDHHQLAWLTSSIAPSSRPLHVHPFALTADQY